MKLYKDIDSIRDYEAWSGAVDTIDRLEELDAVETIDSMLDEIFPDGCDETGLNDFLWFERDYIAELIGHAGDLFDDMEEDDEEEEDEEDVEEV